MPAIDWRKRAPLLILVLGIALVCWAYWVGLHGPLLLDDVPNLAPVGDWLSGQRDWQNVVFGNRSGMLGRPLSMASFLLDSGLSDGSVWASKLFSLLLHLACGVALFALYRRLLRRDGGLSTQAGWLAAVLAVWWLALPIQVSSVLYLVQRMAILSALFTLIGLWLFVVARERIEAGRRSGAWLLWLGVPACTVLAALSKENGLLLPLLASAVELAYFVPTAGSRRPWSVRLFFALGVVLPAVVGISLLLWLPERFLAGYQMRDFTLVQRLLTEPRILWDYIGAILLPNGPQLGIFHDNTLKSTGLLSPWTTLAAPLGWLLLVALAWRLRRTAPALFAGTLLYLFGQAFESTVFPLELYFEHRNYLPSIGVLLAVVGLLGWLAAKLPSPSAAFRRSAPIVVALVLLTYIGATHGRARVWSSKVSFYAQEMAHNPNSPRLRADLATEALLAGNLDAALAHIAVAERYDDPRQHMTTSLWRFTAYCAVKRAPPDALYAELQARAHGQIETFAMMAWERLAQKTEAGDCTGLDVPRLTSIIQGWLAQDPLPRSTLEDWRTRYSLARVLAAQGQLHTAAAEGEQAWRDADYNNGIGVFVFQVNASLGNVAMCREVMVHLRRARGGGDYALDRAIDTFQGALDRGEIKPPAATSPVSPTPVGTGLPMPPSK
jgi:hypothetical protein